MLQKKIIKFIIICFFITNHQPIDASDMGRLINSKMSNSDPHKIVQFGEFPQIGNSALYTQCDGMQPHTSYVKHVR